MARSARNGLALDELLRDGVDRACAHGSTWQNAAFVIEALVLLAALVASMAVFTSLFSKSIVLSGNATKLTRAVQLAESAADEFSSDPAAVAAGQAVGEGIAAGNADEADGLRVAVDVSDEKTGAGTLYTARVRVLDASATGGATVPDEANVADASDGSEIYALDVARYVSEAR